MEVIRDRLNAYAYVSREASQEASPEDARGKTRRFVTCRADDPPLGLIVRISVHPVDARSR